MQLLSDITKGLEILDPFLKKARREFNLPCDNMWIEKARNEFRMKNFIKCMEIYEKVVHKDLMNNLDAKIIEYSSRHIED
jgi:hypothetical protein